MAKPTTTIRFNLEHAQMLSEALTQFIDNQPDVDEPDATDVRKAALAVQLLAHVDGFIVKATTQEKTI